MESLAARSEERQLYSRPILLITYTQHPLILVTALTQGLEITEQNVLSLLHVCKLLEFLVFTGTKNTLGPLSKTVSLNWLLMDLDENTLLFVKSKET